ncbi:hypothetical protein U0070_025072, partial [Myodes glareolus]
LLRPAAFVSGIPLGSRLLTGFVACHAKKSGHMERPRVDTPDDRLDSYLPAGTSYCTEPYSPFLITSCSRGLIRPVSAFLLSRPEAPSKQPSCSSSPLQGIPDQCCFPLLFSCAILGFALSEAMGLFCLMAAFLILFAM